MKKLILLTALLVLSSSFSFASELEIKNQHALRYDLRGSDDLYLTRFWTETKYDLAAFDKTLKISPFIETRYHFDLDKWYRTELGTELGIDLFKWLYFGESLQYVFQDRKILERESRLPQNKNFPELETRLVATFPFKIKTLNPKLYILEEHTFNLKEGEGTRNEIGAGFNLQINKHIEILLGWRHVDRIHDYDSDQLETALTFKF